MVSMQASGSGKTVLVGVSTAVMSWSMRGAWERRPPVIPGISPSMTGI